jgi:hypothetical protein
LDNSFFQHAALQLAQSEGHIADFDLAAQAEN